MPAALSGFKRQQRGRLFYGQYRYSISAYLFEAAVLRSHRHGRVKDHETLDRNIQFRDEIIKRNINYGGSWRGNRTRPGKTFGADDVLALHETLDWLEANGQDKVIFYDNWLQIYTNDVAAVQAQQFWQYLRHTKCTIADVTHPEDVIKLRNPKHSLRHYLKERWLEEAVVVKLNNFFANYCQEIRLSPGFQQRIGEQRRRWMTSNAFFDTNNQHLQMLFEMTFPGLLRKTYRIEPR